MTLAVLRRVHAPDGGQIAAFWLPLVPEVLPALQKLQLHMLRRPLKLCIAISTVFRWTAAHLGRFLPRLGPFIFWTAFFLVKNVGELPWSWSVESDEVFRRFLFGRSSPVQERWGFHHQVCDHGDQVFSDRGEAH